MKEFFGGCEVALGSITQAMKAQKLLSPAAIPTRVIKLDPADSGSRGCVYGLSFSCSQAGNIQEIFAKERIRVKQWKGI